MIPFLACLIKALGFFTAASMTLGIVPDPQRLVLGLQLDRDLGYPFPEPGVCVAVAVCAWRGGSGSVCVEGAIFKWV